MPTQPRVRILAAARALYDAHGLTGLSMRRVAQAVGVTATAIYRHYRNKDDLLDAIAEAGFDVLNTYLVRVRRGATPERRISIMLDRYLDFALEQPRLFEVMFLMRHPGVRQYPRDFAAGRSRAFEALRAQVSACMRDGVFRLEDPLEAGLTLWAHAHGLIALYWAGRFGDDTRAFRTVYRRCLARTLNGLRRRPKPLPVATGPSTHAKARGARQ